MKKIIFLGVILFLASSCVKLEEINIKNVKIENVSFKTMTNIGLDLVVNVENPNKTAIILDNAELDAWLGETYLGLIETTEKTTLAPQTNGEVRIPLQISIANLSGLTAIGNNFDTILDKFEVTGFVKVKAGSFTKKHKVTKTTIKNLLKSL
jgi:LEA14-like dessication related protein